jgi:hypothetical protein
VVVWCAFCEELPIMVLKNKSELFQFAEIIRNLECDSRYGSFGGGINKISIPVMVPVLSITPGFGPVAGNEDQNQQLTVDQPSISPSNCFSKSF